MNRNRMHRAVRLTRLSLAAVLLAGCQSGEEFPFYQLETYEDGSGSLSIENVQYVRISGDWDEQAHYFNDGDQYTWTPAEGIGAQIGVCGEDPGKDASLNLYEVAGDGGHIFLYTRPARFYFGGTEGRLWMRDGVTLGTPTAETVSSITVVAGKEERASIPVEDPTMIAALLEAYNSEHVQAPDGEGWIYGSLIMHHKNYPFLQYEVECRYSPEQEISCCRSRGCEWFVLPAEWFAVIAE